jgi:hypothetical protein
MVHSFASRCRLAAIAVAVCLFAASAGSSAPLSFNRDIRPILSDNCFYCHGPDASHRQADLRLDIRDDAVAAGAIVPGKPAESTIVSRIQSAEASELMPPPESHKKLDAKQKALLTQWIAEGAEYQKHWAYEKPVKAEVPAGAHGVDHLVQKRLAEVGLAPSPEADRRTLIRRLSFDLLGLPPAPDEVTAFEQDTSSDAYARLVERLLASPHYGERMATGWLDVVRFADTIGYHSDTPRNVWPYRDWVIKSFNDNQPFDQFTIHQVAGDLVPDASQETRVGSAFNRLLLSTEEGGAQAKDYEARMLTDRVRAARPDDRVRPVPRPQVRPVHDPGFLRTGSLLRRHPRTDHRPAGRRHDRGHAGGAQAADRPRRRPDRRTEEVRCNRSTTRRRAAAVGS